MTNAIVYFYIVSHQVFQSDTTFLRGYFRMCDKIVYCVDEIEYFL